VQITQAQPGSGDIDDAARIWAEATAARDGDDEVADLSVARPVIEAVLSRSARAFVLIARDRDGTAAGFAAVGPVPAGPAGTARAELAYFGVRPANWGTGVGELLLAELRARLRAAGYRQARLLVYTDNGRAIALYQRLGWRPAGQPSAHPRTGKPEQRFELEL
jgi:ribosomal protein S18 acetylase RimI-like enzyme